MMETFRTLDQYLDHLVRTSSHVVVGPLHYVKSDGRECIQWLVTVAVSDQQNDLVVPPGINPSDFRAMLLAELGQRGSLTVHDAECPHCMANIAASLGPSDRTYAMRASFETTHH
jgi:hypothetical protein